MLYKTAADRYSLEFDIAEMDRELYSICGISEQATKKTSKVDTPEASSSIKDEQDMAALDAAIIALTIKTQENAAKLLEVSKYLGTSSELRLKQQWNADCQRKLAAKKQLEDRVAAQNRLLAMSDMMITRKHDIARKAKV